jgi:uncharacterized membrane protein HdeD (DUF308 family)
MNMKIALITNLWALVLRGLAGIAFGLLTFAWPGITLLALVLLFGAYALVDGVVSLAGAIRAMERHERWGVLLMEGITGILAAIITMVWPGITMVGLVFLVAAWALVTGALETTAAIRLRRLVPGEWLLLLIGIASMVFGLLLMIVPIAGALVIAIWIGAYALVFGVLLVALGFRLRSWSRHVLGRVPLPAPAH